MKAFLSIVIFFLIAQDNAKGTGVPQHGIRIKVPHHGLEFITGYLEKSLEILQNITLPLPDHEETFFGGHFTLKNASVVSIGKIGLSIQSYFIYGFTVMASLKSVQMKGAYDYSILGVPSDGLVDIKGDDIALNVTMDIPSRSPYLQFLHCSEEGQIGIEFDGRFGGINNVLIKLFKKFIRNAVFDAICQGIESNFKHISRRISNNNLNSIEFRRMIFDLSLSEEVWIFENTTEIYLSGNIHAKGKRSNITNDFDNSYYEKSPKDTHRMLYLYITSYTVSQLAEAAYVSGNLDINLTEEVLPGPIKIILKMLPSIIRDLPKSGQTIINLKSSKLPIVKIENEFLNMDISCTVTLWYKTLSEFMIIGSYTLDISTNVQLLIENHYLHLKCQNLKTTFHTEETISHDFSHILERAMEFIDPVIMPILNVWGERGFPIDFGFLNGVSFHKAIIELRKNAIVFSTDLEIDTSLFSDLIINQLK